MRSSERSDRQGFNRRRRLKTHGCVNRPDQIQPDRAELPVRLSKVNATCLFAADFFQFLEFAAGQNRQKRASIGLLTNQ
ncbi:hypothetical protein BKI51_14805 [Alphaproteobacteria bacterium AO1-B]|nr:hypothetical protein BKI51_14805 [Alphaproteobacteria bacterium AO1-B]